MKSNVRIASLGLVLLSCLVSPACKGRCQTSAADAPAVGRDMLSLTEAERRQKVEDDLLLIKRYDDGLAAALDYANSRTELFIKREEESLSPEQKRELKMVWATVLDYMRALDGIKEYWKRFHRYNVISERRAHAEAFLVGYAAWLVQYKHGLSFVDLTVPSKPMEKLLDEGARNFDIPPGAFKALKWNIIHVKAVTRLLGSSQYFKTLRPALSDADCGVKPECAWGLERVDNYAGASTEALKDRAAIQFSYNAFDIARDMSFDAWFPIQKNVASWMGDTKVRRLHQHLVSHDQLDEMVTLLEPGDLLVARHNWYLSNVGLPGFWPHAELYLGAPAELGAYFDDPEVRAFFSDSFGTAGLVEHLEEHYPDAWTSYTASAEDGAPHRIIEAVSEGVVFSSIYRGAGADYVAALRPTRPKTERAAAIVRAFSFWGREYDFNFDFVTDESLVCTELVYKAWREHEHSHGLDLELMKVMGRQTLPANDLVRQFDERYDDDRPLDFVYFLDGREGEKSAIVADAAALRQSWKRPKWDVLQQ